VKDSRLEVAVDSDQRGADIVLYSDAAEPNSSQPVHRYHHHHHHQRRRQRQQQQQQQQQ